MKHSVEIPFGIQQSKRLERRLFFFSSSALFRRRRRRRRRDFSVSSSPLLFSSVFFFFFFFVVEFLPTKLLTSKLPRANEVKAIGFQTWGKKIPLFRGLVVFFVVFSVWGLFLLRRRLLFISHGLPSILSARVKNFSPNDVLTHARVYD